MINIHRRVPSAILCILLCFAAAPSPSYAIRAAQSSKQRHLSLQKTSETRKTDNLETIVTSVPRGGGDVDKSSLSSLLLQPELASKAAPALLGLLSLHALLDTKRHMEALFKVSYDDKLSRRELLFASSVIVKLVGLYSLQKFGNLPFDRALGYSFLPFFPLYLYMIYDIDPFPISYKVGGLVIDACYVVAGLTKECVIFPDRRLSSWMFKAYGFGTLLGGIQYLIKPYEVYKNADIVTPSPASLQMARITGACLVMHGVMVVSQTIRGIPYLPADPSFGYGLLAFATSLAWLVGAQKMPLFDGKAFLVTGAVYIWAALSLILG